ncbi:hypothetical protein [Halomonas sp. PR-M31]|uniref:hypothetical protein n=1 Tax=Halomonas sp. PR-M31 TaxID=1471202 RepID=UPI00065112BF|nr:hypothetical protein [Halomonas sp. PR-M31]
MQMRSTLFIGTLGVALLATTAFAQDSQDQGQKLVEQCHQKTLEAREGDEIRGNPMSETNASDYEPGEEFELKINFVGHGNSFYNVTCQVDKQGNVTHEKTAETGQPKS